MADALVNFTRTLRRQIKQHLAKRCRHRIGSQLELHRRIAGYRRACERGEISWHQLQILEKEAQDAFASGKQGKAVPVEDSRKSP